jgi:hypothetical protein
MGRAKKLGIRMEVENYESWYGWRKDKNSEKYKEWVKKIKEHLPKGMRDFHRTRRTIRQKMYNNDFQRKIKKN